MTVVAESEARLPANYRLVLDVLRECGAGRHLSTMDVFVEAKNRRPAIGYSTVYRGLARLCELGLVGEISVPGAGAAYEIGTDRHAHFRCERCGGVQDVAYAVPTEIVGALATDLGLEITGESLTFRGICSACRGR